MKSLDLQYTRVVSCHLNKRHTDKTELLWTMTGLQRSTRLYQLTNKSVGISPLIRADSISFTISVSLWSLSAQDLPKHPFTRPIGLELMTKQVDKPPMILGRWPIIVPFLSSATA